MAQDEAESGHGAKAQAPSAGDGSHWFREAYLSVDVRWLGVFRILYGTLLIVDLLRRWGDLRFYYSNDGVMPNHFALFRPGWRNIYSFFFAFSSFSEVNVAFVLALACFVTFTLGYRTRLFHALSLFFITSLNARNLFIENGGTIVVNLLGMWTLFLPLGRRFSIDALRASLASRSELSSAELNDRSRPIIPTAPHVSLVVLALLLQWSVIYFFNFVHKSGVGWRNNTAIFWFLEQNRIVTWFGVWVRNHAPLAVIKVMTRSAVLTEGTLSFVMLIPFARENMRRIGLLLACGLHGVIALVSRLGPFSYVMVIQFAIHLSAADFEFVSRWFSRPSRARTVIYDADCGICLWLCRLLKRLDPFERLTFVGNDERSLIPPGIEDSLLDRTLLVLLPDGSAAREERAVFEVARALPFGIVPLFWLGVPGLSSVGNALYRRVAENRTRISAWFGLAQCGVPSAVAGDTSEQMAAGRTFRTDLTSVLAVPREATIAFLLIVLGAETLVDNPWASKRVHIQRPEWMQAIVETPRLFQGWGMFAPEPPYDDGHLVVDGRTVDGRKLDPFTGSEPVLDPYSATGWGDDQLWCDYTNHIRWANNAPNRVYLRDYLVHMHEYVGRPRDKLASFDVWWVQTKSAPPGHTHGEPLPPEKLISFGTVPDSLARPWLSPDQARPSRPSPGKQGPAPRKSPG